MAIFPQSLNINLSDLLSEIEKGTMQLPQFQRDWTWDDTRVRNILASLSQGYPMGAIMRLAYGNPLIRFKYRPITGAPSGNGTPAYLILDGQQRLTSIYQATHSSAPVVTKDDKGKVIKRYYYLDMEKCLDESEDRLDAVLSVPEDRIKDKFDRNSKLDLSKQEYEFQHKMFPMNIAFNSDATMDWYTDYLASYNYDRNAADEFKKFKSEVLNTITSYQLPVITLDKNTPREAVCSVFENVNTGGVALTVFELVTAIYAMEDDEDSNLRDNWEKDRRIICGLDTGFHTDLFDGIDETAYLTTICLYTSYMDKQAGKTNTVSCKKKDVLRLPFASYKANRNAVLDGFKLARNFLLNYQYVFHRRDLPYSTQIIPLAAICAVLGDSKCNEPNTIKALSRWYWCGILGEMYGAANETRYANDIEDMVAEVYGRSNPQRTVNSAVFSSTRLLTLQSRLSAAYKGILALLYKAQCRDFMNDITMNVANCLEQFPDIHHIFPEAYCKNKHIDQNRYNSIVNKTPILPKTNKSISGNAPSVYTKRILKQVNGLTEAQLRERVESHLIDFDRLIVDDFDGCFIERAKRLLDLIEKAMGKPVTDRDAENTIEVFGASLAHSQSNTL